MMTWFSEPSVLLGLFVAIICILVVVFVFGSGKTSEDSRFKKETSLLDISKSLKKEETLSGSSGSGDNRVLNPIQFRPFKVLKIVKVSYNTKLIRFEIPNSRSLGLTVGKHISLQANIDGNKVRI
jgi:hypothetical protein